MSFEDRLVVVLEAMLDADQDITARAASRALQVAPSTITRVPSRALLVERYRNDQMRLRRISTLADKTSKANLSKRIDQRDRRIAELEKKVQILTASHRAMLLAVGEAGGMAAWRRFFERYDDVRKELQAQAFDI